jgi:single stranded DNA-binding protein
LIFDRIKQKNYKPLSHQTPTLSKFCFDNYFSPKFIPMPSLNSVNLIGNLGANPESRTLPSGDIVVSFSMATSETYIDKSSQKVEITDWHRIELWGGLADIAITFLQKGDLVFVEGKLRTDRYTDKEGIERFTFKYEPITCKF